MGRIKTTLIKRTARKLYTNYRERFKPEFDYNKKAIDGLIQLPSKKMRNTIAGYVTRLVKFGKDII
ncbi:30S ribosomal protein S17e [Candidatus Woesearchaeota archaeon]|nr:30S ribosomal protein S17e [Candidatus Woesearchaeota archaeon]